MNTPPHPSPRLIPVTDWNKFHPYPPIGGLRHLIFHGKTNGFDRVVRRVGRRVLIDEAAFFAWVDRANMPRDDGFLTPADATKLESTRGAVKSRDSHSSPNKAGGRDA